MPVVVWKYPFPMDVPNERMFEMPKGSRILCAKMKPNGEIALWALINKIEKDIETVDESDYEMRHFIMIGTGWTIRDKMDKLVYIDTIVDADNFVWHIFEVVNK